jgi:uncharacterized cupredoxin-like copper-binding protein
LRKILFVVMWLSLFVAACQADGPSTQLTIELKDFSITPNTLAVPPGSEIQIKVTNHGSMVHNFYIMKYGADIGEMFDEADIASAYWEVEVQPDDTLTSTLTTPDQPGTYQIVCGIPGHLQSGMVGTLEVVK